MIGTEANNNSNKERRLYLVEIVLKFHVPSSNTARETKTFWKGHIMKGMEVNNNSNHNKRRLYLMKIVLKIPRF